MHLKSSVGRWAPVRLLDWYLTRQLLTSTFVAVLVLSVVMVFGQIFKALFDLVVSDRLPIDQLPGLVWNMFSYSLSYTLPWGVLTGVLLLFGRMSADNELTALRMSGIGLWRIILPVILLAALLSLACFHINTRVAPRAYKELKFQTKSIALNNPLALFEPKRVVDEISGYRIYCEEKAGKSLTNLQVFNLEGDYDPPDLGAVVLAKNAEVEATPGGKSIEFNFTDLNILTHEIVEMDSNGNYLSPEEGAAARAAGQKLQKSISVDLPKYLRVSPQPFDLTKNIQKAARPRVNGMTMDELKTVQRELTRGDGQMLGIKDDSAREFLQALPAPRRKEMASEALTTYNSRFSLSFACIVLALVGVGFGITAQRRETFAGFILSFIVGISYFALISLGEIWKSTPKMKPELWVWLPNLIFGSLGLAMFWKHQRR